jgi:hypothetical protein
MLTIVVLFPTYKPSLKSFWEVNLDVITLALALAFSVSVISAIAVADSWCSGVPTWKFHPSEILPTSGTASTSSWLYHHGDSKQWLMI